MSDGSSSSKGGIPEWQKAGTAVKEQELNSERPLSEAQAIPPTEPITPDQSIQEVNSDRETLRKQASSFLDDERMQQEPLEKKRSFLEEKGLVSEDIEQVLSTHQAAKDMQETWSSDVVTSQDKPQQRQQPQQLQQLQPQSDVAPIITYPEFLIHANRPPPLITASRLLNTAYVAAGSAAFMYGLSHYLVGPLAASLNDARHDLASHARNQIEDLNNKLETLVSSSASDRKLVNGINEQNVKHDTVSDANSDESDPYELFYRDFGTQTAHVAAADNVNSNTSDNTSETVHDPIELQGDTLKSIKDICVDLTEEYGSERSSTYELSTSLSMLTEQLQTIALSTPSWGANAWNGGGGSNIYGQANAAAAKKDHDEIAKMKAEIRGFKGVLLSARNFPSTGGARQTMFPQKT